MAKPKKGGLGRGLDVLIGASQQMNEQHAAELNQIEANSNPAGKLTLLPQSARPDAAHHRACAR